MTWTDPGASLWTETPPSPRATIALLARVCPGAKLMVNVTLTTLFEAMQLGPLRGPADDDDWKWTLRSVANRSILRVLPDGSTVMAADGNGDRDLRGCSKGCSKGTRNWDCRVVMMR